VTGLDIDIQGDVTVVSYPSPHVVINFLDVHSPPEASAPFMLEVKMLEAWPSILGLLHGQLSIDKINVRGVDVELERMKSDEMSWKESTLSSASPPAASDHSVFKTSELTVSDATLRYTNTPANSVMEFDNIAMSVRGTGNGDKNFQLNMRYLDKPVSASGHIGDISQLISTGIVPASFNIKSGKNFLSYDGDFGIKDKHPVLKGKLNFGADDIVPLTALLTNSSQKISDHKALPVKISSDVSSSGDKILLPNIVLDGDVIKGNAQATLTSGTNVDIKAVLDTFDLETLEASTLFDMSQAPETTSKGGETSASLPSKSIFDSLVFNGDIKIADTIYNGQHIKNTQINFDETKGEFNIPQISASLPGDSRIVFAGIGKQGYLGFIWEGEIDGSGSDFAKMVGLFKTKGFALPPEDFKRFRFKANAALSTKDMRFSEIAARIENIEVLGGIIATFGERTKVGAALRIGGLNLDHFITLWGIEEWRNSLMQEDLAHKKEIYISQWLKQLNYDVLLNTSLEQTVLQGKLRDRVELKLEASKNNLVLKNLKTTFNGTQLSGDIGINVSQDAPKFNLDLTADTLDVNSFFGIAPAAVAPEQTQTNKERWTHEQFDFHWLGMVNSDFHFKTGNLKYGTFEAQDAEIKGNVKEHTLTVDSLSGTTMGASIAAKSVITGGKIPTVSVAASLRNVNMEQMIYIFPGLQGITGNYNMTMNLSTNGTDTLSWISNLSGMIALGGRDITIHGFNMLGIISAINYVRTVADILDVVKRAWPGGNTLFSTLQGELVATNGVLKPSNLKLLSPYSDGMVDGQFDLVNWRTQSSITFLIKSLDPVHPPKMVVSYAGDMDAPDRALDTRSLEQFVTNKTSEKLLNQYGH
jgi:uncharacterized protein involved in outer membrane biogenesis